MAYKDPERQRAAERRWYHANKDKVMEKKHRKKERLRQMVREAKSVPCMDCGITYPYYVMDFDHVDGTKVMLVSKLAIRGATKKLLVEMAKCDVVCSNCHRIRTWKRLLDGTGRGNKPKTWVGEAPRQLTILEDQPLTSA